MGNRELRRVPLDFEWPFGKVWKGYINPYPEPKTCEVCEGSGHNAATKQLDDSYHRDPLTGESGWSYDITQDEVQALVDAGRLKISTHVRKPDGKAESQEGNYVPTAKEVNEAYSRGVDPMARYSGVRQYILVETRAKRLGVFGHCEACKGEGRIPHPNERIRRLYDEWQRTDPPSGPGYQLWETTSGGSPKSPVFASAEELADWCAENATVFADEQTSRENWLKMFVADSVDTGSNFIAQSGYLGAEVNAPK